MACKTKKRKTRHGRRRSSKSKRFNKVSAVEKQHEFPEDAEERERKRFKVDKSDLLKSINDRSDKDEVAVEVNETPSEAKVKAEERKRKRFKIDKSDLLKSINDCSDKDEVAVEVEETPSEAKVKSNFHKHIENLTPEQIQMQIQIKKRINQICNEQKKIIQSVPFLELTEAGEEASLNTDEDVRYPLVFPDIQEILTYLQYNRPLTRWLHLKRRSKVNNTIFLSVEGPSLEEYINQQEDCPTLQSCKVGLECVSPLSYGDCVEHAFASQLDLAWLNSADINKGFQNKKSCPNDGFTVGLDNLFNIKLNSKSEVPKDVSLVNDSNTDHNMRKRKSSKTALDLADDKSIKDKEELNETEQGLLDETEEIYNYCFKTKQALPISLYKRDNFSRLDLVMTLRDMATHKYPLPFIPKFNSFVRTKDEYNELTEKSPMFGLDCEMCLTSAGSELTRISVVNEKHEVVYERLVKPHNKILNYLTKFSGITHKMLKPVQTRLADVQREIKALLPPNAILVGQSLNFDLMAMQMMHPYVIDSSCVFNLSGSRESKTKLKTLSAEFLSEKIQEGRKKGHDSIEDALAALKLVQEKLTHSLDWGDAVLGYKRTEEESQIANLKMLEKEKERVQTKCRLAFNALVDDASQFDPPTPHLLSKHELGSSTESKSKKMEEICSELYGDETNVNKPVSSTKRKEGSSRKDDLLHLKVSNYSYSEVAVIGLKKVFKRYDAKLPESAKERVQLIKACDNEEAIKHILDVDSNTDKKRLILAHLKCPSVCQVEKWANELISQVSEKDLVCILLCGNSPSVRGAFFATIPTADRTPTKKDMVQVYLKSIKHLDPQNFSCEEEPDESCDKELDPP